MQGEIEKLAKLQAKSILEFYEAKYKNNFMLVFAGMFMVFLLVITLIFSYLYIHVQNSNYRIKQYDIQYNVDDLIKLKERKSKYYEYKYYKQYTSYGVIYITIAKRI